MGHGTRGGGSSDGAAPLLCGGTSSSKLAEQHLRQESCDDDDLWRRVLEESKKLWVVVGPAIFTRTATYSLNVIMQAFAGHLGDLELASVSFACTVLAGFNYGLMVRACASSHDASVSFHPDASQCKRLRCFGYNLMCIWNGFDRDRRSTN